MTLVEPSVMIAPRGARPGTGDEGNRTVVWLRGDHDACGVASLSSTLATAMAVDDADFVVDLSGVDFMDAATVGAIIGARNGLRQRSRSLALRCPSRNALLVLTLCELTHLLEPKAA